MVIRFSRKPYQSAPGDWDFLIFIKPIRFSRLAALKHLRRANIDVFVVIDGDIFEELWFIPSPERRNPKKGSLAKWEWQMTSDTEARYVGMKARQNSVHVDVEEKQAICLWRTA